MNDLWAAAYSPGVSRTMPSVKDDSLIALFNHAVATYGARIALESGARKLSYRQWAERALSMAAYLQSELGVQAGQRVAMMCPNVLASLIGMMGTLHCGATQVNVNPMYSARELEHQLVDADVGVIVVHVSALPTVLKVLEKTRIEAVVVAGDDPEAACLPGFSEPLAQKVRFIEFCDVLLRGSGMAFQSPVITQETLAFLQYTGGTTGVSKGAMLTHGNLLANIAQFLAFASDAIDEGADGEVSEVVCTALPLYHIFALMVNTLSYLAVGGTNVLVGDPRDLDALVDLMTRRRFTAMVGVNTLYVSLMAHPRFAEIDFSSLRVSWGGGAPIPPATSERWRSHTGQHIKLGYGLSETSPILTLNPVHLAHYTNTVGLPLPGTDITLRDDRGVMVPIGERGEIWAKGPQVMSGYWRNAEATAQALSSEGYFKTGDIGMFDAQGFLSIVDRKKDMVLVSGFNVYPAEVEAVAMAYPGVREAAVVAVPDARSGEAVKLCFSVLPGASVDHAGLLRYCRAHLAAYKVPQHIEELADLPKSTVGKVLRRELRPAAQSSP